MLKPIPSRILRSTAKVLVPSGTDRYQKPEYTEYTVSRVHIQPTSEIRKTSDNTEITLRSVLFVDAHTSAPALDWAALLEAAQAFPADMKVEVRGQAYTVIAADALRDDTDVLHHWEISLA